MSEKKISQSSNNFLVDFFYMRSSPLDLPLLEFEVNLGEFRDMLSLTVFSEVLLFPPSNTFVTIISMS